MFSHVHFAAAAAWLLFAIVGLVWTMACALTAAKMEKEGFAFWNGFLAVLLLSPLTGVLAIFIARILRPGRPLAHTVSRG
jgi:nicotinamide riboside transporter PnuC